MSHRNRAEVTTAGTLADLHVVERVRRLGIEKHLGDDDFYGLSYFVLDLDEITEGAAAGRRSPAVADGSPVG